MEPATVTQISNEQPSIMDARDLLTEVSDIHTFLISGSCPEYVSLKLLEREHQLISDLSIMLSQIQ